MKGRFTKMLWSWKKDNPEVLTAEMSEMKHDNKVLQLEELESAGEGASSITKTGIEEGTDAEQLDNNNENPIDHTGTHTSTTVEVFRSVVPFRGVIVNLINVCVFLQI